VASCKEKLDTQTTPAQSDSTPEAAVGQGGELSKIRRASSRSEMLKTAGHPDHASSVQHTSGSCEGREKMEATLRLAWIPTDKDMQREVVIRWQDCLWELACDLVHCEYQAQIRCLSHMWVSCCGSRTCDDKHHIIVAATSLHLKTRCASKRYVTTLLLRIQRQATFKQHVVQTRLSTLPRCEKNE